jgi:hypothetical protein
MPRFNSAIRQETEDVVNKLKHLMKIAVDERKSTVYKAQVRKFCNRVEKALHLVKDAQTIIGE